MSRFLSTPAFTILLTAVVTAFIVTPWWAGFLGGAAFGLVACLFSDGVEYLIRYIVRGRP